MAPPYSPILARAAVRNIVIPYIVIYLSLPVDISLLIHVAVYVFAPLFVYITHVAARTQYHRYRAWKLSAMMVPFIDPAFKPKGSPWYTRIGNLDLMIAWDKEGKQGYLGDGMVRYALEGAGGTVNTRILGEDSLITSNPRHIHQILSGSFTAFPKGDKFKERAQALFGPCGVFVSDGIDWNFHRSSTRPFFSRRNPAAFDPARTLEPHTSKILDIILATKRPRFSTNGDAHNPQNLDESAIDIQALFLTYTLDIATEFFFGHCTLGLDQSESDRGSDNDTGCRRSSDDRGDFKVRGLAEAFAEAQAVLAQRIKMGTPWSLFELGGNRMDGPVAVIREFVQPLVDRAISQQAQRHAQARLREDATTGETCCSTLLDHLVDTLDDRSSIEDELMNILVAARDTSAAALTYSVYCLVLHPSSLEKLRAEITAYPRDTQWSPDRLQSLKYLNAFISEVLRLYPPVPLNIRRSACEVLLEGSPPLYVPAGTSVILATLLMQRKQELWGEDSEQFIPERWLSEGNERDGGKDRKFIPFSAGPRTCLGQGFALMQLSYFIVRLMQALTPDLETSTACKTNLLTMQLDMNMGCKPPLSWQTGRGRLEQAHVASSLTMYIKGGLWIGIRTRDSR